MGEHNVGNRYVFLGHQIELLAIIQGGFGITRYSLGCNHGVCCTVPNGVQLVCLADELDTLECTKEVDPMYYPPSKSKVDWQAGDTAEIREPWEGWGHRFIVLGPAVFLKQWWVPVESDEHGEPDFQKEASLIRVEKHGI